MQPNCYNLVFHSIFLPFCESCRQIRTFSIVLTRDNPDNTDPGNSYPNFDDKILTGSSRPFRWYIIPIWKEEKSLKVRKPDFRVIRIQDNPDPDFDGKFWTSSSRAFRWYIIPYGGVKNCEDAKTASHNMNALQKCFFCWLGSSTS